MRQKVTPSSAELLRAVGAKLRAPALIVLGSPREAADLAAAMPIVDVTCYQMDLYQAERLQEELAARQLPAQVRTAADLWDLPAQYQTVLYPVPRGGERSLKLDMIEQAFHVLPSQGNLVALTPYEQDQVLPAALKKVFKRARIPDGGMGMVFLCQRHGDRPRRRHEMTYQVRSDFGRSLRFLSRPGVFSYGRFDNGARALVETMAIQQGDRVLDLGCGCGTNGIFAGLRSGPDGFTAFVDSNIRAVGLAEFNAAAQGLTHFQAIADSSVGCFHDDSFDVVLANPPYYAQHAIAQLFIAQSLRVLRPGGRLYLVTKQPDVVGALVIESFSDAEAAERRGYHILCGQKPERLTTLTIRRRADERRGAD
jgi:16S rRNA G1207 methylase RsmC